MFPNHFRKLGYLFICQFLWRGIPCLINQTRWNLHDRLRFLWNLVCWFMIMSLCIPQMFGSISGSIQAIVSDKFDTVYIHIYTYIYIYIYIYICIYTYIYTYIHSTCPWCFLIIIKPCLHKVLVKNYHLTLLKFLSETHLYQSRPPLMDISWMEMK
jgi:hypothetical protein